MSCLNMHIKIEMILKSIKVIKDKLKDDSIRPSLRDRLMDDLSILKVDLKQLLYEYSKIISN